MSAVYQNLAWPYEEALRWMATAADEVRQGGAPRLGIGAHDTDVITLGKNASRAEIVDVAAVERRGVRVVQTDRGGGATAHGPGQIVAYPVIKINRSVKSLSERLCGAMVDTLAELGIAAVVDVHGPGVYVGDAKIGSLGFRVDDGVVRHGLSLNVNNDPSVFGLIAVCGRRGAKIARICDHIPGVQLDEVVPLVVNNLEARRVIG